MDYKLISQWLEEYNVTLEENFTDALSRMAKEYNNIISLNEVYIKLGCNKTDISRWKSNPCSTQLLCARAKISVVLNAAQLFNLSEYECENLANKAGLSLLYDENISLAACLKDYNIKIGDLVRKAFLSERMFQYYLKGKKPTKQVLLAIVISLNLPIDEINILLCKYGYCLSESLPNDVIVIWHLKKNYTQKNGVLTLNLINEVLERLKLPLLMTKIINR